MSKELEALNILRDNHIQFTKEKYGKLDEEKLQNIINRKLARWDILEQALNELEDAKHNYKAVKEMYDNSVAYATKIQKELNELKKRNEPMKPQTKTYTNGFFKLRACSVCDTTIQKDFVYCPYCGQKLDWSDEK